MKVTSTHILYFVNSYVVHGRKHWMLYPPDQKPYYNPDFTSRAWMEYQYTDLEKKKIEMKRNIDNSKEEKDESSVIMPWECTVHPGEMIYFPDMWHHATLNLDTYNVFVSTFTTETQIPVF